jgi:hypothetical protein
VGIYQVKETQWGYEVVGPEGHSWICPYGETRSRAVATAKAFEHAHALGALSILRDPDFFSILDEISTAYGNVLAASDNSLKIKVQRLLLKADQISTVCGQPFRRLNP